MSIVFDKDLETGNELIDGQHKELIDRVNRLVESCTSGKEKNVAVQTLDFLMDYTELHFAAEEKLQEEAGYPELEGHKAQHAQFKKAVDELREITENYSEAVRNNDTEKMITFDERFHKKIVASSGNKTLIQLSETVQELALRFRYLYYDDFSRYVNMPVEHKEIIDALTSGNGDMARQSADDHVKKLKEFVINEGDRAFR